MINRLQVYYDLKKIIQANRCFIIEESKNSWNGINFEKSEPNIIWDYLNKGTEYLNRTIGKKLSCNGFDIKFGGVFVHQKPRIERIDNSCQSNNKNCELGDLLTVFLLIDKDRKLLYQSAFISQAKKENKIDNNCQRCLYEFDKKFKLPKNMGGAERNLPKFYRRQRGLNYLILDKYPCIKHIPFDANIKFSWGNIIYQTLIGLNGLYFAKKEPNNSNRWSKIIWDLVNNTGIAPYKGESRGNMALQFLNYFKDNNDNFIKVEEGEYGIPILFIIVQYKG